MNIVAVALLVSLVGNILQIVMGLLNFYEKVRTGRCIECRTRKALIDFVIERENSGIS